MDVLQNTTCLSFFSKSYLPIRKEYKATCENIFWRIEIRIKKSSHVASYYWVLSFFASTNLIIFEMILNLIIIFVFFIVFNINSFILFYHYILLLISVHKPLQDGLNNLYHPLIYHLSFFSNKCLGIRPPVARIRSFNFQSIPS